MGRIHLLLGLAWSPSAALADDFELPGTQPGELTQDLRTSDLCGNCHGGYGDEAAFDTWAGSMMANAARDPLFRAALAIANQDHPGGGDLCLRCHTPRGWLFGRSEPTDGSALEEGDLDGVNCDFCHRLVPAPDGSFPIGSGQFFVADDVARRGTFETDLAPHDTVLSPYHSDGALCGLCHDVTNPTNGFPVERTYTEWATSAYPGEGATCQTCHLPATTGFAGGAPGLPERTVHRHLLVGGNTWIPRVLAGEHPELARGDSFALTVTSARAMLQSAATVTIEAPAPEPGSAMDLTVRVENLGGHKLPTGYPEGRRCWLEVVVRGQDDTVLLHSGAYDPATGDRASDPQLRRYEVQTGEDGAPGFHFLLANQVLSDTRIPARGMVPTGETAPVGRSYARPGTDVLAHWDEAPYRVEIPAGWSGTATVTATLWYQTTSRPYVEFLRDENRTDSTGAEAFALWEAYDRSPPEAMASASLEVVVPPPPDPTDPTEPTEPTDPVAPVATEPPGGCGCAGPPPGAIGWAPLALAGASGLARRARRRGARTH